jgi:hypothetical protein
LPRSRCTLSSAWARSTRRTSRKRRERLLQCTSSMRQRSSHPAKLASTAATDGTPKLHAWLRLVISMAELYLENAQADESGQPSTHISALELALLVCHNAQGSTPDSRLGRLRARARSLSTRERLP